MKTDLYNYNKVTDQIVSSLEQGVRPWMQPWLPSAVQKTDLFNGIRRKRVVGGCGPNG
jgi:antirestriction protein ArdC